MTTLTIEQELIADETAALADRHIKALATAAVALAVKAGLEGAPSPNPSLPGNLYGKLLAQAGRIARLRFVAGMGERPTGAAGGYFTRESVMDDVARLMREAAK